MSKSVVVHDRDTKINPSFRFQTGRPIGRTLCWLQSKIFLRCWKFVEPNGKWKCSLWKWGVENWWQKETRKEDDSDSGSGSTLTLARWLWFWLCSDSGRVTLLLISMCCQKLATIVMKTSESCLETMKKFPRPCFHCKYFRWGRIHRLPLTNGNIFICHSVPQTFSNGQKSLTEKMGGEKEFAPSVLAVGQRNQGFEFRVTVNRPNGFEIATRMHTLRKPKKQNSSENVEIRCWLFTIGILK